MGNESTNRNAIRLLKQHGLQTEKSEEVVQGLLSLLEKELEKNRVLASYVPSEVLEAIQRNPLDHTIQGQRRQATIMFIDVCGFTAFSETNDPETIIRVLNKIFEVIVSAVTRHGGSVDKFLGDAALANFGVPEAHGDDPARAVFAAVDIVRDVRLIDLFTDSKNRASCKLNISIGIHTGLLVTGNVGAGDRKEWTVIGDTVNIASRLRDLAKPGEIVIGESTFEATNKLFDYEALAKQSLKGKSEKIQAYRFVGESAATPELEETAGFVGRRSELRLLDRHMASVIAGKSTVVSIVGQTGIGKTRLIHEWLKRQGTTRKNVVFVNASFEDRVTPFRVIAKAIRQKMSWTGTTTDSDKIQTVKSVMERLKGSEIDGDFIARCIVALSESRFEQSESDESGMPRLMLAALLRLISLISDNEPAIIVCDSFQWFDQVSADIVRWVAANPGNERIMLVVISRLHEPGLEAKTINLRGLAKSESNALTQDLLDRNDLKSVSSDVIRNRAGDNPLFLHLLIGYAKRKDVNLQASHINLPINLHSAVQAQIDAFDADTRQVLEVASVKGDRTQVRLIAEIAGLPEELVKRNMGELSIRGVAAFGSTHSEFVFQQDIIRQTCYDSILLTRRALLHERIGRWLQSNQESSEVSYEEIVFHLERGSEPTDALHHLELAAENSNRIFLYDIAISQYLHGLEIIKASAEDRSSEQWKFLFKVGRIYHFQGKHSEAEKYFKEALGLSKISTIDTRRARSLVGIGDILSDQGKLTESLSYYHEAMRIFQMANDVEGELLAYVAIGIVATQTGDWDNAMDQYQKGLQIAMLHDNPQSTGVLLSNMGILSSMQKNYTQAIEFFLDSLRCFEQIGLQEGSCQSLHNLGMTYEKMKDYDNADYYYRRSQETALEIHNTPMVALSMLNRSQVIMEKNDYNMARAMATQALSRMIQLNNKIGIADAYLVLGKIEYRSGNIKRAGGLFILSLRVSRSLGHRTGLAAASSEYGRVLKHTGFTQRSTRYLKEAMEMYKSMKDEEGIEYVGSIIEEQAKEE